MTAKEIKKQPIENSNESVSDGRILILYNDDVHTFDYVITALMEVCDHDYFQASQCATLTHYKGKCEIKRGGFSKLKDMKDALTEMELSVTID